MSSGEMLEIRLGISSLQREMELLFVRINELDDKISKILKYMEEVTEE